MSNVPLPRPGPLGLIQYAGVDMQEYAAAVSAAKDKEMAQLRAELIKSLADNAALRADAIDRQNNVVAPLRAEVAGLREALQMWLTLHDNPAGYAGKYGKALDAAIAAQQTKIDAAATAARTALAARKGEA